MRIRALLGFALVLAVAAEEGRPVRVELADGEVLRGRLLEGECSDEALVIQDIRTGAKQEIPWDRIEPRLAKQFRVELGFEVGEAEDELGVDAVEIVNRAGSVFRGKLLNAESASKDGEYRLKTSKGPCHVPVSDVLRGPTAMRIGALDVYTPSELYDLRLQSHPPADAEGHFLMAEFARKIGALEQSLAHYRKVLEIPESKYSAETVQRCVERIEKLLGQKEAMSALRDIREAVSVGSFAKAAKLLEEFKAKYTDEDLQKEATELEADARKRRNDYFIGQVQRSLFDAVRDALERKAKEKDSKDKPLSLRDAMQYASGPATQQNSASFEAVQAVAQKLGIAPEEVSEFWKQRNARILHKAFYRTGTFIVIPNLKDALQRAPKPKPPSGRTQGKAPPRPPAPHPQLTPDQWWKELREAKRSTELRDFLYAFWAEKSGMVETIEPKDESCATCNGNGYVMLTHYGAEGSVPYADRCSTCHMATFQRVVRFR